MAKQLIYISTSVSRGCPICSEPLDHDRFEDACSHVLGHGLKCLHVGQETHPGNHGEPWHSTVAVFGD